MLRWYCQHCSFLSSQIWEEGDEGFHTELLVPALLIYGAQDQFVTLEEEQWMLGVRIKMYITVKDWTSMSDGLTLHFITLWQLSYILSKRNMYVCICTDPIYSKQSLLKCHTST